MPDQNMQDERAEGDPPEDSPAMTDAERKHLAEQVEEIKRLEAERAEQGPAYDIQPPTPEEAAAQLDGEEQDTRTDVMTAFLVYVTEDGKAIATSEIEEALGEIKPRREATLEDLRRASIEVADDIGTILQTQSVMQTQMAVAQQMQERAKQAEAFNSLDLSKIRNGGR